jgi:hypothetical protein
MSVWRLAWDPGQKPRRSEEELFINPFAFLVKGGSQQVIGHVHEQAEVAGSVLAEGLQKRRVHEFWITGHLEQVVQTLEQLGRGQGFGAQSRPDAAGDGKRWASSKQ